MRPPLSSLRALALLGTFVLRDFALGSAAQAQSAVFTDQQKQAIGQVVKEYLLQNPEILTEAMAEFEKRQSEAQKVAQAGALKDVAPDAPERAPQLRRRQPLGRRHPGRVLRLQLRLLQARPVRRPR